MTLLQVKFDPRSKLCTILFASFSLMVSFPFSLEILFVSLLCFLFILSGSWKKGVVFYSIFWLLVLGEHLLFLYSDQPLLTFFSFLFVGNRRMLPTVMAAAFAMDKTKISEWIAALQKWRVPFYILIPLTVLFRFFPTLIQDFKSIRNAMKFRGIAVSTAALFLHPFQTMEYIIIPVLMSAENTSLDLSSAALVRGLSNTGTHTSVYALRLRIQDYLLLSVLLLLVIGRSWLV
ncbi:energy-coupling factor transporter transmembrane component T [Enterococcus sp. BWR-S5]|uniref:energy-coupling factor transporter transmembrane component T n=1 Tax=Enterococcus sp. BWR-S5 TaxID=2787714 RepID=UPI0019215DF9|nr:energy-coupling factor transporter transmembrane component T [Enterococcus sp. BWR-S5]MBL1226082.1 energy-coupling factor transporter transmembrane protein EcfT [Enterococcus sp. BWR-S5]